MASLAAALVALLASSLLVRGIIRLFFDGSVERVSRWVRPRRATRTDVAMSELGEEVAHWRFARMALIAVLAPVCFGFTFLVMRGVLLAVF